MKKYLSLFLAFVFTLGLYAQVRVLPDKVGIGTENPEAPLHVLNDNSGATTDDAVLGIFRRQDGDKGTWLGLYGYPDVPTINNSYMRNTGMLYLGLSAKNLQISAPNPDGVIRFTTGGWSAASTERMRIDANGNVGIGTSSFSSKLTIQDNRSDNYLYTTIVNNGDGGSGLWLFNGNNTTGSSKVIMRNAEGDSPRYWAVGNDRTDGNKFKIAASSDMEGTSAFVIDRNGRIGIGTSSIPSGYKVAIDGNTICEELMVELSGNWPDYVFQEDYELFLCLS